MFGKLFTTCNIATAKYEYQSSIVNRQSSIQKLRVHVRNTLFKETFFTRLKPDTIATLPMRTLGNIFFAVKIVDKSVEIRYKTVQDCAKHTR